MRAIAMCLGVLFAASIAAAEGGKGPATSPDIAREATVHGNVAVVHASKAQHGNADVVVWLTPLDRAINEVSLPPTKARLVQRNKRFEPHVVAITVGSAIDFPNLDPFFHNVFSIYRGKPFDLGLYERGTSRSVRFMRPGVSYIFCNIHPEMSAAVIALRTPYFAMTGDDGRFTIPHVPAGRYKMELWYEFAAPEETDKLQRAIEVAAGQDELPSIALHSTDAVHEHLNKYGETYDQSHPPSY